MFCGQRWSNFAGPYFTGAFLVLLTIAGCSDGAAPTGGGSGATGGAAPVAVDVASQPGCEGAVVPTLETIEKGEYRPLSRPLFVYVNAKALQKPEVAGFVKTMLGTAQDKIEAAGFIKLKSDLLREQRAKLDAAIANVTIPAKIASGTVSVNGSSTVFPFSSITAELFEKANDGKVRVTVGKKGTGGGFEKFCTGETDINNASRPIKKGEAEKCKANGIEYIDFTVCMDGISVCVNPNNNWCYCLSVEQLKALFEPDSKVKKWKDLNPSWPDKPIELFGPDNDSGTFEYFTEVTVGKAKSSRSDYTQSAEDNVLVKGIVGNDYALGYFGYSYYDKNRKTLRALGIKPAAAKEKKTEEKKSEETKSDDKDAKEKK